MRILLKHDVLESVQTVMKLTDQEFAEFIGVSRSQLWRAKLPPSDRRFSLGQDFIAKVLNAFADHTFEELFFLDEVSHACDNERPA